MRAAVNTWADHAAWDRSAEPAVPCRLGARSLAACSAQL